MTKWPWPVIPVLRKPELNEILAQTGVGVGVKVGVGEMGASSAINKFGRPYFLPLCDTESIRSHI